MDEVRSFVSESYEPALFKGRSISDGEAKRWRHRWRIIPGFLRSLF